MKTEIAISAAAWNALYILAQEYLHKGGNTLGINSDDVAEAHEALGYADRIVQKSEDEES